MKIAVTGDGGAENLPRPKMPQRPEPLTDTWTPSAAFQQGGVTAVPAGSMIRNDRKTARFLESAAKQ